MACSLEFQPGSVASVALDFGEASPHGGCGGAEPLASWPGSKREGEEGLGFHCAFKATSPVASVPPSRSRLLKVPLPPVTSGLMGDS